MTAVSDPFIMSIVDSLAIASSLKPKYEKNIIFWLERNKKMVNRFVTSITP